MTTSGASPATSFVADTVALVLRLELRRLGSAARSAFDLAERGDATLYAPAIVFAEVLQLSEKRRIATTLAQVESYFARYAACQAFPLTLAVARTAESLSDIPELHDRLMAATARHVGAPLIANDPVMHASTFLQAIW